MSGDVKPSTRRPSAVGGTPDKGAAPSTAHNANTLGYRQLSLPTNRKRLSEVIPPVGGLVKHDKYR